MAVQVLATTQMEGRHLQVLLEAEEAMIYFAVALASFLAGMLFSCSLHCRFDPDEEWCGCDGSGMAHIPGSKGFECEVKP